MTDIDIDFCDRKQALAALRHVPAVRSDLRRVHPSGVYFQDIPVNPLDHMAVWDYETAEQKGYFKIDFLGNGVYQGVRSEVHLVQLLTQEPPWDRFVDPATVAKLAQISTKNFDIMQKIKPRNIYDLAVCLALIRKRRLVRKPRDEIEREIWIKAEGDDPYHFKRSHAIAYAASIVVQLNLMVENHA